MVKKCLFILSVVFSLSLGKANGQELIEPLWKFYFAFEDATGARDTLWVGLDEAAVVNNPNPALGEVASQMDSTVFNVWTHKFGSWDAHKTIIYPIYSHPSLLIYGMNAVLPITLSWDTTLFNAPALQASLEGPICNPVLNNPWFSWNSNAGWLHNVYSMLFDTEVVLPEFSGTDHFPIGVALDRGHNCSLLNTSKHALSEQLVLYPNPCIDELSLRSDAVLRSLEVYNLQGQLLLHKGGGLTAGGTDELRLDVGSLPPGMYMLQVQDAEGRMGIKKFVKGE